MRVTRDEVLRIARLAEIAVSEADLPVLVEQLDRIVDYVAQLEAAPASGEAEPFVPGPDQLAWRDDVVAPQPLALPPSAMAPVWRGGFFVVPRLTAMEDA
jgi:aspartyl-tRNA(Asn)/glutamyl-tRNA(Gln) amidotransferase subunit C